ncbi:hypothetical protein ACFRJ3_29825 [Streptomyces sp. NPDC056696]
MKLYDAYVLPVKHFYQKYTDTLGVVTKADVVALLAAKQTTAEAHPSA